MREKIEVYNRANSIAQVVVENLQDLKKLIQVRRAIQCPNCSIYSLPMHIEDGICPVCDYQIDLTPLEN